MPAAGVVGLFDSLTGGEVFFVLLLALVILGPDRLPEVARTIGQWLATVRRMTADLQSEMRDVMDDPAMQSIREVGEFVAQPRKKLSELVTAAETAATDEAAADEAAAVPETEPEPETEAAAEPETETAAETEPEAEPETDAAAETEPETDAAAVAVAVAEPEPESESRSDSDDDDEDSDAPIDRTTDPEGPPEVTGSEPGAEADDDDEGGA